MSRASIKPALAAGTWVVTDRFADSTLVYQGIARGLGIETVQRLSKAAFGPFAPDLTLVLDVEPSRGLQRAGRRATAGEDRYERFDAAFHAKLRQGYKDIAVRGTGALRDDRWRTSSGECCCSDVWRAIERAPEAMKGS